MCVLWAHVVLLSTLVVRVAANLCQRSHDGVSVLWFPCRDANEVVEVATLRAKEPNDNPFLAKRLLCTNGVGERKKSKGVNKKHLRCAGQRERERERERESVCVCVCV